MKENLPKKGRIVGLIVSRDQFSTRAAVEIVARGGKIIKGRPGGPVGIRLHPNWDSESEQLTFRLSSPR